MKVIFRKFADGSLCALFPEVAENSSPFQCGYYSLREEDVGKVSCHYQKTMDATRATIPKEHRDLLKLLKKQFSKNFQLVQQASVTMERSRAVAAEAYIHTSGRTWQTAD